MRIVGAILLSLVAVRVDATILLDDTLADGDRTNNSLPSDSAQWAGLQTGATYTVTAGKGAFVPNTSSNKLWTYFTSDQSAPNGSQPHNSVTSMNAGDTLKTSLSFRFPQGSTLAATPSSSNIRWGVFFDPTEARTQTNTNTDSGPSSAWQDAQGYAVFLGFGSGASSANQYFQIGKRTNNSSTNLIATAGAYTQASKGGTAPGLAFDTDYTLELAMKMVSATQMDVSASLYSGRPGSNNLTLLTSQTVSDTGAAFGGQAIVGAGVPNNSSVYNQFDQVFFRASNNTDATEIDFNEFRAELIPVPEPAAALLVVCGISLIGAMRLRSKSR